MQTTTTTTAAKSTPKQFTFGVTENHKNELGELRKEFTRPAAVAKAPPVPMSEKEMIEILYTVATDRRFKVTGKMIEETDADGNQVFDTDGNPSIVAEVVDLFEIEWNKIKARDYSEQVSKTPTIDGLIAQVRKYGKALNLSEDAIAAMIASATAGQAAPVEA